MTYPHPTQENRSMRWSSILIGQGARSSVNIDLPTINLNMQEYVEPVVRSSSNKKKSSRRSYNDFDFKICEDEKLKCIENMDYICKDNSWIRTDTTSCKKEISEEQKETEEIDITSITGRTIDDEGYNFFNTAGKVFLILGRIVIGLLVLFVAIFIYKNRKKKKWKQ